MKKNKIFITFILLLGFTLSASAQNTTLKVMQYDLLNYGNNTGDCNTSNNNVNDKNGYIRTILTAYYPDILTVCEMGKDQSLPYNFLDNNLNINGVDYWRTEPGTITSATLTNCIFYNSLKLTYKNHVTAQTTTRAVDVYNFEVNNNEKTRITFVIAHLKAGSYSSDADKRRIMAENTMNYLERYYRECNVLIMGDFNLYSSSEQAYQTLTDRTTYPNSYFIDPLYPYGVGEWHDDSYYKDYHTQSTHSSNDSDCHVSGGLDDRFDFILMSENIYSGRDGVRYISGSYNALGQDGKHFNKSINYPTNSSVSQAVADALFNNSDHLPVTMELQLSHGYGVNELNDNKLCFDIFPNPAVAEINIRFYQDNLGKANLLLYNTLGQVVYSEDVIVSESLSEYVIPVENLQKGFYFLKITNADGLSETVKVIKE